MSVFVRALDEVPKALIQALFALGVAWLGAEMGFWGNLKSANYRYRVEAVAALAGDGADLAQTVRCYFEARINAQHYAVASQRFGCGSCKGLSQEWYFKAHELLVETGAKKGQFLRSLSTVRMLFPKRIDVAELLARVDDTRAWQPLPHTDKATNLAELESMRKAAFDAVGPAVNGSIVRTVDELVHGLEEAMIASEQGSL